MIKINEVTFFSVVKNSLYNVLHVFVVFQAQFD